MSSTFRRSPLSSARNQALFRRKFSEKHSGFLTSSPTERGKRSVVDADSASTLTAYKTSEMVKML